MNKALTNACQLLQGLGTPENVIQPLSALLLIAGLAILLLAMYMLLTKVVEPLIDKVTRHTDISWDDIVFRHKAIRWVWMLILTIIAYKSLPSALAAYPSFQTGAIVLLRVALILNVMMITIEAVKSVFLLLADRGNVEDIVAEMHAAADRNEKYEYKPSHSLKGLQQMLIILIVGACAILVISTLIGRDPLLIFSGLGAMAAVLMLVFQDSILGVVAGVQITANDMLRPGDWIVSDKYGANGVVREVTLAAVKVQNWDQTIITIPPYKLLSEGFQNWRGMYLSKGRRVARSVNIDMTRVRFATEAEVSHWEQQSWWKPSPEQGRMTNITAFRMYLEHYLTTIPTMLPNMTFMIRELQPTPDGLPIELYFFSSQVEWVSYEKVQAAAIDHVLAVVGEFGLRIYQHPSELRVQ